MRDHNSRHKQSNHDLRQNRDLERQPNHNNPGHNPERCSLSIHNHNTRRRHSNRDHNPERSSNSTSNNTRSRHNSLNLDVEILKEGTKENRIEGRITKSLSHHEKAASYKICRVQQENYLTLPINQPTEVC